MTKKEIQKAKNATYKKVKKAHPELNDWYIWQEIEKVWNE